MLKSLPASTIVFDRNANIVDINQPALDFLQAKSIHSFRLKRWGALNDCDCLRKIISELVKGRGLRDKIIQLNCPDAGFITVNISASMLAGLSKIFIFQFFELPISQNSYQDSQNDTSYRFLPDMNNVTENKQHRDAKYLFGDNIIKRPGLEYLLDENIIELFESKSPLLTRTDAIICAQLYAGVSILEISRITNKSVSTVHRSLTEITKKLKLNSRRELYQQFKRA